MANNSISLVNLDFDTLKATLKTYLKSQAQFQDYDFNGSNMSVLLDILTYNTHLNAFYMNMAVSEMFLDSAQLRNSVISKSKELNYTPKSARSSQAVINIKFPQSNLSVFTIPAETMFSGKTGNGSFTYTTDQTEVLYPTGGYFTANISIYQGVYNSDAFIYDSSVEGQRFVMSNDNIDTDSLVVVVSENNGQSNGIYTRAEDLYGLTPTSNVYFLQATEDTRFEVVFGDGVLGRKPLNGAAIYTTYRTCAGSDADGSTNFTLDNNLGPVNGLAGLITPTITVIRAGSGGANAETIDSIRYNAPRHYQTQNRAITKNDYKNLVLNNFVDVKAVNVYGGESVVGTVEFGKVFISPVTYSGAPLSDIEKQEVETFLQNKCTLGINTKVIDPDYLYLNVTATVKYDAATTILTPADIQSVVSAAAVSYNEGYLVDFDTSFRMSRFQAALNAADTSILSNDVSVVMQKNVNVYNNEDVYADVQFRNQIVPGTVSSSMFVINGRTCMFVDYNPLNNTLTTSTSAAGVVLILNSSNSLYLKDVTNVGYETYAKIGTIDYDNGIIKTNKVTIQSADGNKIEIYATPFNADVAAYGNDLVQINTENLNITAYPE